MFRLLGLDFPRFRGHLKGASQPVDSIAIVALIDRLASDTLPSTDSDPRRGIIPCAIA